MMMLGHSTSPLPFVPVEGMFRHVASTIPSHQPEKNLFLLLMEANLFGIYSEIFVKLRKNTDFI
jgi:hypothetical protein